MQSLLVLAVVGFFAQFVDGALGMAYGVTSTTLLLAVSVNPAQASASVHLAEVGTTLFSGASHWRFGNVDWRTVRWIAIPGAAGAFVGASLLGFVSTELAKPWMALLLLALGVYVLARFAFARSPRRRSGPVRGRMLAGLGLVAGFIDATGGGGWGPVATPTLLASGRLAPRKVVGSVDTSEFMVSLAASLGFLWSLGRAGLVWEAVAGLLIGGLVAAPLAAWAVRLVTPRLLGVSVGGLIILTNGRTLAVEAGVPIEARTLMYLAIVGTWAALVVAALRARRRDAEDDWDEADGRTVAPVRVTIEEPSGRY